MNTLRPLCVIKVPSIASMACKSIEQQMNQSVVQCINLGYGKPTFLYRNRGETKNSLTQKLIKVISSQDVDVVVIDAFTDIARDQMLGFELYDTCKKNGVDIVVGDVSVNELVEQISDDSIYGWMNLREYDIEDEVLQDKFLRKGVR